MVPLDGGPAGVAAGVDVLPGEEAGLVTVVVVGADTTAGGLEVEVLSFTVTCCVETDL